VTKTTTFVHGDGGRRHTCRKKKLFIVRSNDYRGWKISQKDGKYFATKEGFKNPIEGIDLPDLKADINEAEK